MCFIKGLIKANFSGGTCCFFGIRCLHNLVYKSNFETRQVRAPSLTPVHEMETDLLLSSVIQLDLSPLKYLR